VTNKTRLVSWASLVVVQFIQRGSKLMENSWNKGPFSYKYRYSP